MNNEQTAKVIDRAADIIEKKGWAKTETVKLADNTLKGYDAAMAFAASQGETSLIDVAMKLPCSVCIEGALAIAEAEVSGDKPSAVLRDIFVAEIQLKAVEFSAYAETFKYAKAMMGKRTRDFTRLFQLNDYTTTRQEHVLEWLRGTAKELRKTV